MCTLLPCPLCAQPCFNSVERLRDRLIYVSTQVLTCPVCLERVSGMDKLTIHLFGHVDVDGSNAERGPPPLQESRKQQLHQARQRTSCGDKTIQNNFNETASAIAPSISANIPPETNQQHGSTGGSLSKVSQEKPLKTSSSISRCDRCGLVFANEQILELHSKLLHEVDGDISSAANGFQCYLCDKRFKMKGSLMVHLRVVHCGVRRNISKRLSSEREESVMQGDETISTTTVVSQVPELVFPPTAQIPVSSSPPGRNDKAWFCEVCEKSFTTKYFLKKHKRLHTGETPYSCLACNKSFTFQQSYHKHLLYHRDDKPHACATCGRAFKELSTLHNHERIHTGEKPFSCETCGKCFRQRVSYLVHRRIHTGAMPYRCTACDKTFRYKVSQRMHKCPAQPPGTVVRRSGQLLDKLKQLKQLTATEPESASAQLIRAAAALSFEDAEADNFELISPSSPTTRPDNMTDDVTTQRRHLVYDPAQSHTMRDLSNQTHTAHEIPKQPYMACDTLIQSHKMRDRPSQPQHTAHGSPSKLPMALDGSTQPDAADDRTDHTTDVLKKLCLSNCESSSQDFQSNSEIINLDVIYKELSQYI